MKDSRGRRILLVGDDTSVSARLADLLAERGYDTTAVHSRAGLKAALAAQEPDLIIVCGAAGASGESALTSAARLFNTSAIPFVLLTTSWAEDDARAGAEGGALAVLASSYANLPHCVPAICAALERHLELRQLRHRAELLSAALQRARAISAATGVLMERMRLNQQQAFEALRAAARAQRCRLSEFAGALLLSLESLNTLHQASSSAHARWKREPAHGRASSE